jgi:hypothetical protein
MNLSPQPVLGRLWISTKSLEAKPQRGGKRPPDDPTATRYFTPFPRSVPGRSRHVRHLLRWCATIGAAAIAGSAAVAQPVGASLPDLSGTYRCEGNTEACKSAASFTVTQSGADLQIKTDKGDVGTAKLTSNISISAGPTWNMLGLVMSPDNHAIQWSNGTTWRKQ